MDGIAFASIFRQTNHGVVWAMGVRVHPKLGLIKHTLGAEPNKRGVEPQERESSQPAWWISLGGWLGNLYVFFEMQIIKICICK